MSKRAPSPEQPRQNRPTFFSYISPLSQNLQRGCGIYSRLHGAGLGAVLSQIPAEKPRLIITADPESAEDLAADLRIFSQNPDSADVFTPWDILPSETDQPDLDVARARISLLKQLKCGAAQTIIAPITAIVQPTLSPEDLEGGYLSVSSGKNITPEVLLARLVEAGFESAIQVEAPGQFVRRGGIIDVFPLFAQKPTRIDFFGDEIDTVRYFDPATQESESALPENEEIILLDVSRTTMTRAFTRKNTSSIFSHLPENTPVLLVHPERSLHDAELYISGFDGDAPLFSLKKISEFLSKFPLSIAPEYSNTSWPETLPPCPDEPLVIDCQMQSMNRMDGGIEVALGELRALSSKHAQIEIYCNNAAEQQRLSEVLAEKDPALANAVTLKLGRLSAGFYAEDLNLAIATDHEIFGRKQLRRTAKKRYSGNPIADFTSLKTGDTVVHVVHGIARYEGIETIDSGGTIGDHLCLRFAEDRRLYVPLSHIDLVQRYVGSREARPPLSKLGTTGWARRKLAAEKAVRDIAADLLRMQAVRRALPGISYPSDDELQMEFDNAFPFEETPDQLAAISDIKSDQQKPQPMDRLLCGDVGFGKTEVAMRAAFKTASNGKQVAVLVPTTILAEQHYRTFRERMAEYPVRVVSLSRFRTPQETRDAVEAIADGRADILIGTHRILSQDVNFKDLGLVIIDEEQRFGVEHKERLKELRASVDILTMTATPIPRTLNMAMLGLRDISNLATAPVERQAIRTMVVKYSESLIRRAILRELARGGQVFFLHNRVHNIDHIAADLCRLVPEAKFGIAHGQMDEGELLEMMTKFIDHKLDVLVCTSIIESGVDIPNVNTLFVNNADHFGLSELHQLRGRVGRYKYQAYAYFLIPPHRPVTPVAQKRLQALEEYSELGAGFRLAMRDLEIRGAGNVLGAEQSGQIHNIGFDLYCRLLEKVVADLKGEKVEEEEPVELDIGTHAYIPTEYINDETQRIDFYRRLSSAKDNDALLHLRKYLHDRYGSPPEPVDNLFDDQRLRHRAMDAGLSYIGRLDNALVLGFQKSKGSRCISRLRCLAFKTTPLEGAKWRVQIARKKLDIRALNDVLCGIINTLSLDDDEFNRQKREGILGAESESAFSHEEEDEYGKNYAFPLSDRAWAGNYDDGENISDEPKEEQFEGKTHIVHLTPPSSSDSDLKKDGKKNTSIADRIKPKIGPSPAPHEAAPASLPAMIPSIDIPRLEVFTGKGKKKNKLKAQPSYFGGKPNAPISAERERILAEARAEQRRQEQLESGEVEENADITPEPQEKQTVNLPGTAILSVQIQENLGLLTVSVAEHSFDARAFGTVTVQIYSAHETPRVKKSLYFRYTGTAHAATGQTGLTLRADTPDEAKTVQKEYAKGTPLRLHPGIFE